MKIFGMRLHIIVLIFAVTLAALWGGNLLYRKYQVDQSLVRAFDGLSDVTNVEVVHTPEGITLDISLTQVDDLRSTYNAMRERIQAISNPDLIDFKLEDNRNDRLTAAYNDVEYDVMEAASTGHFSLLHGKAEGLVSQWGLTNAQIRLDQKNIYVQLNDGEHYLYEVVPRMDLAGREGSASL